MKLRLIACVASVLIPLAAGADEAASGRITLTFVEPERFTDAGTGKQELQENIAELGRHIERKCALAVRSDEALRIEIIDLDLAGQPRRIGPQFEEQRVIDGKADWPIIRLRYTLERKGAQPRSGEEAISDMTYFGKAPTYPISERLHYEKTLIDRWIVARFIERVRP
jgi:hypothetical protein